MVLLLGVSLILGARADADSVVAAKAASRGAALGPSELAVVRLINSFRTRNGAPALLVGRALSRAAQAHSTDMARRGYFDHGAFEARLRRFGVRSGYIGENLASGTRPLTPAAIVRMWIQSPPHRENLLDRGFRRIGVGEAGGPTRLVTADFSGP
ncbi:MAG TPA: CAP domain-containing protein [Gaiellaceae bacterium]|nr:CAP domain-containing protein [Gaiellaceae bacterium]